ncbi:MAG: metallophosphoesterase [Tenuifilaceae bacterium]
MKVSAMIIFLTIVLSIYTLVNWYIFSRTSPLFVGSFIKIFSLKFIFWTIILAYPVGRILERFMGSFFTTSLIQIGSFWLGAMLYLILIFLLIDFLRVINHWIPFTSFLNFKANPESKIIIIKSVYIITVVVLIIGFINARFPRANHFNLSISKPLGKSEKIRIVAVSDIHLGTLISSNRLYHLVEKINSQNPDIVLFAGDVFDEDIAAVVNNGLGKYFEKIVSPKGVYAIPGNHEYFGGIDHKIKYLNDHGVAVLRDSSVLIDNSFYIVGRDDRQSNYSTGKQRKNINDLVALVDKNKPIILLDHQPFNLKESADNGVDLQISGHTHHGQLWPFGYITNAIYELSSGYKLIGDTHFIVSNGFGTWGPPIRLGNRPEILVIDLTSK